MDVDYVLTYAHSMLLKRRTNNMKKVFNLDFKNRNIGFYISVFTGLLSLILGIIILSSWKEMCGPNYFETHNFVAPGVLLLFAGLIQVALWFIPVRFSSIFTIILSSIAFGLCLLESAEFIAETVNQTGYVQGVNFGLDYFYIIASGIIAIAAVIGGFFPQTKDDSEII